MPVKGEHLSEEQREHLRKIGLNQRLDPEYNRKQSESHKGKFPSEETRRKMSEAHKGNKINLGRIPSEETRRKMSESQKKRFEDPDEVLKCTKHLIGNMINLGRIPSEETRKRLSESAKNKSPMSEETREKLRQPRGKHKSELIFHHTKYKEIHGIDEGFFITFSEHKKIHMRLRREGKCNIPPKELNKISSRANKERKSLHGLLKL